MMRRSAHISKTQLYGCPKCGRGYSRFEERIEKYLKANGVAYEYQKKFDGLRGRRNQPLPFDFYIPDKNLIIEFDGVHHYRPVKFGSGQTIESQLKKFEDVISADAKKNEYAMDKGIDIIRISNLFGDKIELILAREVLGEYIPESECDTPVISFRCEAGIRIPGSQIGYNGYAGG
ncbi:MAG: hypothetical protein ACYDG4_16850 [Desulfuromonadaceae bacterium]